MNSSGNSEGLREVVAESQVVNDGAPGAIRAATSGESDAQGAQRLLETLQQCQKARSESKQNTAI